MPEARPAVRTLRWWGVGVLLATLVATAWVNVSRRGSLPERFWAHPGNPWCPACESVPRSRYCFGPDGAELTTGGSFTTLDGSLVVSRADSPLDALAASVEREFRSGERSYRTERIRFVRSGRRRVVNGHDWTEYERESP